jgi:hypothetical protein
MSYTHVLEITSHWAAILTAVVAVVAYVRYRWGIHSKLIQLENYLKAEKAAARDKGQRTILHLMARLGLTEAEVLASKLRQQTHSASNSCRSNDPPCRRDTPRVRHPIIAVVNAMDSRRSACRSASLHRSRR